VINSFKSYLVEEKKTLYFVWGRMNPPTAGHEKLLDFLKQKAGNNPYRIYLTQSEDSNKNPIPYVDKVKFARKGFPQYARQIVLDKNIRTIFDALTSFYNEGFTDIVIVAGEDRIREYQVTLPKYNGKKARHGFYNFKSIQVLNAGKRDPESQGVEGVSGTKLRQYVKDNDFTKFSQYMPKRLSNADTKAVFNAVRKGLGLKESTDFARHIQLEPVSDIRESYINGKLFNEGDTVVVKETGELATIKTLGSNYVIVETPNGTYRKWLDAVEKVDDKNVEYEVADFSIKLESLNEAKNPEDPDIGHRKGSQPVNYHKGLGKSTKVARDKQFKKQAKMADDNPAAYKPAPGDKTAKTKPSKYTKAFKAMYDEQTVDAVKDKIAREREIEKRRDAADQKRQDRMLDRARAVRTRRINRRTTDADV
jgi:hypothetical protein